eukprot:UN0435
MLALINNGVLRGKYQGEASVDHFEDWLNTQLVMKTGISAGDSVDLTGDDSRPAATASHAAAASAVISNFVARYPTKSKILNIYIYGGIGLAMLVGFLCALFRLVDAEDADEDEHEKEG